MKNQTRLIITMSPERGNNTKLTYNAGIVTAILAPGRNIKITGLDSFFLYNDELMLLDYGLMDSGNIERSGRSLKMTICKPDVWLPGKYFLLLHYADEDVLCFDIVLDEHATFHVGDSRHCPFMSQEHLLSQPSGSQLHLWEMMSSRPGMRQFKQKVIARWRQSAMNKFRSAVFSVPGVGFNDNYLVYSSGYRMVSQALFQFRSACKIEDDLQMVDCASLYDPTTNNPYEKLNELFPDTGSSDSILNLELPTGKKTIYCLENISALMDNGGKQIIKKLRQHCGTLIITGSQAEIESLFDQNPSLRDHFPAENHITIEPFTAAEVIHWMLFRAIKMYHLYFSPEAKDKLCRILIDAHRRGTITQWTLDDIDRFLAQHVKPHYCQRMTEKILSQKVDVADMLTLAEDIDESPLFEQMSSYDDTLEELNSMVGLADIKQSLTTIANNMHLFVERRQLGLHTSGKPSHHAIFMGNPGTGKTTVARLLGKIYHSLGLLSKGEVICVDRTRIIGRYIGETEENMKQILHEARGNVLFIDEAYTLYSNSDCNDFGRRAVECLLNVLTQKNPDMLIIFAGYEEEMDKLMSMNPGLVGRFPYKFLFKDYSAGELMQIALTQLSRDEYQLTAEAAELLRQTICETIAQKNKNFGNARWIEQYVNNGIIPALANRLATTQHPFTREVYQRIEVVDIQQAFEKFNPKTIELKPRRQVGFSA